MDNLPTAVFAAIGIEIASEAWKASYPNDQKLVLVFLFFVLVPCVAGAEPWVERELRRSVRA